MTTRPVRSNLTLTQGWVFSLVAFAILALASLGFGVGPARACPPGHYGIGGGTAGWVGCAPMDGGVGEGNSLPSIEDMDITAPGLSTYDAQKWMDFFEHMGQQTIEDERRRVPPHLKEFYEELLKGTWIFAQSRPGADLPVCSASFHGRRGGIMFMDWGGSEPGTTFSFFGHQIPRAKRVARVRVQLEQSGETQEVEAFHTGFPIIRGMGMVMLRVPSTHALLAAIEDEQDYDLRMDELHLTRSTTIIGRMKDNRGPTGIYHSVSKLNWHTGLSARDFLKKCLGEQDRLPKSSR